MVVFKNYDYSFLDTKDALRKLLTDGFTELAVLAPSDYKVNVFTRDPVIDGGSPGSGTEIPCVTIFRTTTAETDQFIGEVIDVGETGNNQTGRFFNEAYELRVWASTAEMRDDISYGLMKIFMVGKTEYLENQGVYLVRLENGQDGQDHTMLPGGKALFFGIFNISLINSFIIESRVMPPIIDEINLTETEYYANVNTKEFEGEAVSYDTLADFPVVGVLHTLYLTKDTGLVYLWTGDKFVLSGGLNGLHTTKYPDLASFPAVGNTVTLYLAEDTGRAYLWVNNAYLLSGYG